MKRILSLALCFLLCGAFLALAADPTPASGAAGQKWKTASNADRQKIAGPKQNMKQNTQAGKSQEQALLQQLREARMAKDTGKIKTLEAQLKALHQAEFVARRKGHQDIQKAQQDLLKDRKAAKPGLPR